MPTDPSEPDLAALLPSWELHLSAERKSPATIKYYGDGGRSFLQYCRSQHIPAVLDRRTVKAYITHHLALGAQAATVRARQLAVRRFSAWAAAEGEIEVDQLVGLKAPKLDVKVVTPLTDDELKAMLRSCVGRDLVSRRDEAMIRVMLETGLRASQAVSLQTAHWSAAVSGGDLKATELMLKVSAQRTKLLGLDSSMDAEAMSRTVVIQGTSKECVADLKAIVRE